VRFNGCQGVKDLALPSLRTGSLPLQGRGKHYSVLIFHGEIKIALSYCCRSILVSFDDSVKTQIDLVCLQKLFPRRVELREIKRSRCDFAEVGGNFGEITVGHQGEAGCAGGGAIGEG
jgi:hypothetical protein